METNELADLEMGVSMKSNSVVTFDSLMLDNEDKLLDESLDVANHLEGKPMITNFDEDRGDVCMNGLDDFKFSEFDLTDFNISDISDNDLSLIEGIDGEKFEGVFDSLIESIVKSLSGEHERNILDRPFVSVENRIDSFKGYNDSYICFGVLNIIDLAKAGFFYNDCKYKAFECFFCGFKFGNIRSKGFVDLKSLVSYHYSTSNCWYACILKSSFLN